MYKTLALTSLSFLGAARAQQVGTNTAETHPSLSWKTCTGKGGTSCTTKAGSITLDSNWRWAHNIGGSTNCYTGNTWDATLCPDGTTCAKNCAIDGADYAGTYGITTASDALSLKFVTKGSYSTNIGSRTYLMESDTKYQMFNLVNNEFTFDVDVSKLPCGLNGALYFVEMAADGGINKGNNKAGAKYGTGYCDSQCPHDIKWINGVANSAGWVGSANDPNAGAGTTGACCPEMDIWEANSVSTAYTPHPCKGTGLQACTGTACGDGDNRYGGVCDKDGCDFNSYRMGVKDFYGPGQTLNTAQKMTVVTQFIGSGSKLSEIKRFYVQNGKVFKNSNSTIAGVTGNSITDAFCTAQKSVFGDTNSFATMGGLNAMGASLARGHVLVMSLWDDHAVNMLWLDSTYPVGSTKPGAARGTCATTSGTPADVEANSPGSTVVFSNIRFGPIGSTFAQPA
ncbi:glycoside hydrolase family 7 protein [Dothidotthia symphoricarpi CBS 119687]|uniref:Glucanase n=1 Tax=Dothidotthia symphoricarpi CBS 119687 TaxID=1392245 RepID=A0A6A6ACJ1_9PLEO|nr:glycoside hydrolase family 7 protein [Dothidotthia symphoricarpi CBS 119687]KAF2129296.1 glycoside hydrolase family 7 protein [Dothidotthia symphoricarpi CBS 119687]